MKKIEALINQLLQSEADYFSQKFLDDLSQKDMEPVTPEALSNS